ncbi:MAG: 5-methyltetrahydropteroyltriglutamate--homocysteine methyltransferase [Sulfolobaceae archaeon]
MKIQTAVVGSYPKPIRLAKTQSKFLNKKIDEKKYQETLYNFTKIFLNKMKNFNIDYVTSGLLRFDDIVDITFSYLEGAEKFELVRFFDNNFYYRKPLIKNKLKKKNTIYLEDLKMAKKILGEIEYKAKLKAVILGPLTYYRLSDDSYYNDEIELIMDYSKETNSVIKDTEGIVDAVEIHEPSISEKGLPKKIIERLPEIYDELLKGVNLEKHLITYFKINNVKIFNIVNKTNIDIIGFDAIENKKKLGMIYKYLKEKNLYLGVIDSRNTKLDKATFIKNVIETASKYGIKRMIIGNSSLLDFIPEVVVERKLKILSKVVKTFE